MISEIIPLWSRHKKYCSVLGSPSNIDTITRAAGRTFRPQSRVSLSWWILATVSEGPSKGPSNGIREIFDRVQRRRRPLTQQEDDVADTPVLTGPSCISNSSSSWEAPKSIRIILQRARPSNGIREIFDRVKRRRRPF